MSSGERPIGAAKGKQSDIEALCQPPPQDPPPPLLPFQCLRLTAKILLRRLQRQVDLSLTIFGLPPARGTHGGGVFQPNPPPPPLQYIPGNPLIPSIP